MSESSGRGMEDGIDSRQRLLLWFDALFRTGFSSIKHYFALFGKGLHGIDFIVARFAY
jgi:hypothetical protein